MQERIGGLRAVTFAAVVVLSACHAGRTAGMCAKACTVAADCCPPAAANCPVSGRTLPSTTQRTL